MPRIALALATAATLLLNGSVALATMPAPSRCTDREAVCVISLRMMVPPPARPADLTQPDSDDNRPQVAARIPL
ncbi:MAG: hypothetical protein KDK01_06605 [Rhodobacteraceae bacterium]|jgi:hypothetical protein|nr:hypothetical protein [Paracoccaceae bacterium]